MHEEFFIFGIWGMFSNTRLIWHSIINIHIFGQNISPNIVMRGWRKLKKSLSYKYFITFWKCHIIYESQQNMAERNFLKAYIVNLDRHTVCFLTIITNISHGNITVSFAPMHFCYILTNECPTNGHFHSLFLELITFSWFRFILFRLLERT